MCWNTSDYLKSRVVAAILPLAFAVLAPSSGSAQKLTILHAFTGGADGGHPTANLIRVNGKLYGTASAFGSSGAGTVFELNRQQKFQVFYDFKGGMDGSNPAAGLVRDQVGNFYGITRSGGTSDYGTVFTLNKSGVKSVIHNFKGGTSDGEFPQGVLLLGKDGRLHGAAYSGGGSACSGQGCGIVFSMTKAGREKILHKFTGGSDGGNPVGGLVEDANGNTYGTTTYGGVNNCFGVGCGTVFKLNKTGKLTTIYRFQGGTDGGNPQSGVVLDADGNLYGTTFYGGAFNLGTVFKLDNTGVESVLYNFCPQGNCPDGSNPMAGLVLDSNRNLFGTAAYGGSGGSCMFGCGTVFKLDQSGKETVLHSFTGGSNDGARPFASLIFDASSNLYGTTYEGGPDNNGAMFKIAP